MSTRENLWRRSIVPIDITIREVINNLNDVGIKIAMVINTEGILQGTISDGDIRRGLLKGLNLTSPINSVIRRNALVVTPEHVRKLVVQLMVANKIHQIPVVDREHRIVGLHLWDEISTTQVRNNLMVIMAGGLGKRLRPHTENCPKPLLTVSGKPMLEHIIDRAKSQGFNRFLIAINYLGHMIEEHFGSGERLGVQINYLREEFPMGTVGALSLLSTLPNEAIVVTNGDVITEIRYDEILDFHARQEAVATMAVRLFEWQHPYGVVQMQGVKIIGFEEKPLVRTHINAGVYSIEPVALSMLVRDESCDMPTLFERLQLKGLRTVAYPMHEPWLDIGQPADLDSANEV